jgi:hypothetical protein
MTLSKGIRIAKNERKGVTKIIGTEGADKVFWDQAIQRYHFYIGGKRVVNTFGGDDIIGIDPDPWQTAYYGDMGPVYVNAGRGDDRISIKNRTGMPFFAQVKGGPGFDRLYIQGYGGTGWSQKKSGNYLTLSNSELFMNLRVHRSIEEILPL